MLVEMRAWWLAGEGAQGLEHASPLCGDESNGGRQRRKRDTERRYWNLELKSHLIGCVGDFYGRQFLLPRCLCSVMGFWRAGPISPTLVLPPSGISPRSRAKLVSTLFFSFPRALKRCFVITRSYTRA